MAIKKKFLRDGSTAISFVDKKGNEINIAVFGDELRFFKDGVLKGTFLYTQESINDSDIVQTLTQTATDLVDEKFDSAVVVIADEIAHKADQEDVTQLTEQVADIEEDLTTKVDTSAIKQEIGSGETDLISQAALTTLLNALSDAVSIRLVAKPLPDYNTEELVDSLFGENSQGVYSIELGEWLTYPNNIFDLEVLRVDDFTWIHRMYIENRVYSRFRNSDTLGWTPWKLVSADLSTYLSKEEATEVYATTEQLGSINDVLDILNGDLEGDVQEIIDNMSGV